MEEKKARGRAIAFAYQSAKNDSAAIGRDLDHTLAIKRTPSTFAFLASNGEVAAADDGRILQSMTSAFNFLRVARIKLKLALFSIELDELNGNNAATSSEDKFFDFGSLVHGGNGG